MTTRSSSEPPRASPTALVGCAGWSLPRAAQACFANEGTHLERYASRFAAVEINSSFYRPHRPSTYARWAASVPGAFRFAVKVPRAITHARRLAGADAALDAFLGEAGALGDKLGCLLVQLPPSLAFDEPTAASFFRALRARTAVDVACEPRSESWFEPAAHDLLARFGIARVAADPARVPAAAVPGGSPAMVYRRLHGSPRVYYSAYEPARLDVLATAVAADLAAGRRSWCIFDNTALGAATTDALGLLARLTPRRG